MTDKKLHAQHLYLHEHKTQKEIAAEIGVSERTIYTWIHQYAWDKLKRAAYQAPATISENLCNELIELQNAIARREPGARYPTVQEAEVIRKLVICIERLKKYPSLSQNMQMLETFKNYMRPIDKDFTRELSNYSERYLTGKSVNGFVPYELEYGLSQVAPVMSVYDEPVGAMPCACPNPNTCKYAATCADPCTNIDDCKHQGSCTYPHCTRTKEYINEIATDRLQRNRVVVVPAITDAERRKQYEMYMEESGFAELYADDDPQEEQTSEPTGSIPEITPYSQPVTSIDGTAPSPQERACPAFSAGAGGEASSPSPYGEGRGEVPEVSPLKIAQTLTGREKKQLRYPHNHRK